MIAFAVIGWILAAWSIAAVLVAQKRYLRRLASKNKCIDALSKGYEKKSYLAKTRLEELERLSLEIARLTPKRNVRGRFVGKGEGL